MCLTTPPRTPMLTTSTHRGRTTQLFRLRQRSMSFMTTVDLQRFKLLQSHGVDSQSGRVMMAYHLIHRATRCLKTRRPNQESTSCRTWGRGEIQRTQIQGHTGVSGMLSKSSWSILCHSIFVVVCSWFPVLICSLVYLDFCVFCCVWMDVMFMYPLKPAL